MAAGSLKISLKFNSGGGGTCSREEEEGAARGGGTSHLNEEEGSLYSTAQCSASAVNAAAKVTALPATVVLVQREPQIMQSVGHSVTLLPCPSEPQQPLDPSERASVTHISTLHVAGPVCDQKETAVC